MSRPRFHDKPGFTLLEVLVAMAILGVGILGVMTIFPEALSQARMAAERTVTAETANSVLGQLRASGAAALFYGQVPNDLKKFERAGGLYGFNTTAQRMRSSGDIYFQRVTFSVQFADDREETYVTYIAKH